MQNYTKDVKRGNIAALNKVIRWPLWRGVYLSFVLEKPFGIGIRAGRLGGENLLPHKEMYDRLITLLAIAKQRKERLMVHIV